MMMNPVIMLLAAYGLGCLSTAYLLIRLQHGQDIRTLGSGNAGARNAGRHFGSKTFAAIFIGDAGKAVLAVYAASWFTDSRTVLYMVLLAVVAGHVYPVFLRFRGGKGMSPFAGGALALDWRVFLGMLGLALVLLLVFRRFTPAGLIAIVTYPFFIYGVELSRAGALLGGLTVLLILFAHRSNIKEMIRGGAG
ncbi:glycerol-3-phosphate acyltransferase [Paenibacillus sp. FJAT-26967]|uniref:glycerol-3-phosphate acyltransferase n=1 Tax=Paenibacillus sp. FJAT-26967 TaxID=1729690 RepID=UPI0008388E34|nr:glycerol-3-phosphate acyltransferase [Paenibacillus sp. FJAT-26967]